jgi:uncharacterized protein YdhG (YjbR/CyaY superfamily)
MTTKAKPENVLEYINAAPKEARKKLREMRACLRKAAPGSEESLKWGTPAFSFKRILFTYAGYKRHIGFYPTPSAVKAFAKDLSSFKTAKGSIQFPLDKPLPTGIIRRIAAFRIRELNENDASWM